MTRQILQRIALAIPILFVMTFLTFFLVSLVPGNAAIVILGQDATQTQIHALNTQLGLNQPLWDQYLHWVGHALDGNFGTSLYTGQSVVSLVTQRFLPTLYIGGGATIVAAILGVGIGMIASLRGGVVSRILDTLSMFGISVPNFWLALLMIVFLATKAHLLPSVGYVSPETNVGQWVTHLILPVVALGIAGVALIAKQVRDAYGEALSRDFIRFMQANGIPRRSLLFRHALRHASVPIVSAISVTFINLFTSTAALELIFAVPGLGSATVQATLDHDLSVVQGTVTAYTVVIVAVTLLADVLYSVLNPRVGVR